RRTELAPGPRATAGVVPVAADAQLRAVVHAGRDPQANFPLPLDRAASVAARTRLPDTGRTGIDLEDFGGDEAGDRPLAAAAAAVLALRVRQRERAASHAGGAADDRLERDHTPRSFLCLEAPHFEVGVDVVPTHDLRRTRFPERVIESLVAAPAVAVAVVEQARLALRQHRVRLGELAEAGLGVRRVGDVRVPVS